MSVSTFVPPAVADLMSRAGASDQDRPAWLAERRGGVTATEIRDLAIGKKRQGELVDLKLWPGLLPGREQSLGQRPTAKRLMAKL